MIFPAEYCSGARSLVSGSNVVTDQCATSTWAVSGKLEQWLIHRKPLKLKLVWHPLFSICILSQSNQLSHQKHRKSGAHKRVLSAASQSSLLPFLTCFWWKPRSHSSQHVSFAFFSFSPVFSFLSVGDPPFSSLFLSKANSTSTGQLDKLVSPGLLALTPESEEEHSLPPQRVSTFRPRPYSMADSNKVRNVKAVPEAQQARRFCTFSFLSLKVVRYLARRSFCRLGRWAWFSFIWRCEEEIKILCKPFLCFTQQITSELASPPPSPTRCDCLVFCLFHFPRGVCTMLTYWSSN